MCLVFQVITCEAQENLYLHIDKQMCYPGDTLWMRAYLTSDTTTRFSTSFYVELYNEKNTLLQRSVFPVVNDMGFGQLVLPLQTGYYWVRGYTLNASSMAVVPVTVSNACSTSMLRKLKYPRNTNNSGGITISKNGDTYIIHNSRKGSYSLSITDTVGSGKAMMVSFQMLSSYTRCGDTSWLTYHARLKDNSSKVSELVMYFQQDSVITHPRLLPVDTLGNIRFPSMYFFDTGYIHYRLKTSRTGGRRNVLMLVSDVYPTFVPPSPASYYTDTVKCNLTLLGVAGFTTPSSTAKQLKTVEIKSRWHDRHLALDRQYVVSPDFQPTEQFTFDLRNPVNPGGILYVLDYLQHELPPGWAARSMYWDKQECAKGVYYYVDEKEVSGDIVAHMLLKDFAYVKVYQDLHPPCPAICLYTRKGNDLKALPSDMSVLPVKGYDKPLKWTTPDRVTWLWEPYVTAKEYRIAIPAKTFRIVVLGSTVDGEAIFFEKTVKDGKIL